MSAAVWLAGCAGWLLVAGGRPGGGWLGGGGGALVPSALCLARCAGARAASNQQPARGPALAMWPAGKKQHLYKDEWLAARPLLRGRGREPGEERGGEGGGRSEGLHLASYSVASSERPAVALVA